MQTIQRLALVGGLLLATAAQASDPFQQLYEAARDHAAKVSAGQTPARHMPLDMHVLPSPVQSVMYGRRLPNGETVTYCRIEHTPAFTRTDTGGPQRPPREQR